MEGKPLNVYEELKALISAAEGQLNSSVDTCEAVASLFANQVAKQLGWPPGGWRIVVGAPQGALVRQSGWVDKEGYHFAVLFKLDETEVEIPYLITREPTDRFVVSSGSRTARYSSEGGQPVLSEFKDQIKRAFVDQWSNDYFGAVSGVGLD